jgi:hypothetical protein
MLTASLSAIDPRFDKMERAPNTLAPLSIIQTPVPGGILNFTRHNDRRTVLLPVTFHVLRL